MSRLQSIRMVLAQAAEKSLDILQYDVHTIFINSLVDETIFVKMVPGREEIDKNRVHQVMRLR